MTKTYTLKSIAVFFFTLITSLAFGDPAPPIITGFSPSSGPVGTSVIITGTNFNATIASNIVFFGATRATVTQASETSLTVTVPAGAMYQPISVLNGSTRLTAYSARPFIPTFSPNKGSITNADFSSQLELNQTSSPAIELIALGDLDGDGKTDLVSADTVINTVVIFRNLSTNGPITAGSFAAKVNLQLDGDPGAIVISDMSGDGKPDLVVVDISGKISVFRNTSTSGTLSFDPKTDLICLNPIGVSTGDIDGDGRPDVVVSDRRNRTVLIFRNTSSNGSIAFANAMTAIASTEAVGGPEGAVIGDLDGDLKADLAVVYKGSDRMSIFRNISISGNIILGPEIAFVTGQKPENAAMGDFNADGKPDLVVTNSKANNIFVFQNNSSAGNVSLAAKVTLGADIKVRFVNIADLDGDGKVDIITTAINGGGTVSAFRNVHASGNISASSFASRQVLSTKLRDLSIGDIDGDGRPDLAGPNVQLVSVLRNSPFKTKVSASFCGTTLTKIDSAISADLVASATGYRFRINQGGNVQTIDVQANSFKLTQLTNYAYNTAYTVDVQVLVGGSWSDYGAACVITTPVPVTQLSGAFRGTTLASLDSAVRADSVLLATGYRFRVTRGSNVQTIDVQTNSFKLTQLTDYALSTTYTIDIAVQTGGTWSAYGAAYNVTTPMSVTQVSESFRGKTLANIDSAVRADPIPLATGYRFRITQGGNVQSIDTQTNSFKLTQLASYAYNTTYSIDAQNQVGGNWSAYGAAYEVTTPAPATQISESFRGKTLPAIDGLIDADQAPLATAYRFRVTQGSTIQTLDVQTNSFKLTQLTNYAYNTTYSLDVAVQIGVGGTWSDYGAAYNVTTPVPVTQISAAFRGKTLANIDSTILADAVLLATGYRFRITQGSNVQTLDAQSNFFKLTQLTSYAHNTTYGLDVAVQTGGTWSLYGTAYNVTTPVPVTQVSTAFRGNTLANIDAVISADPILLATGYRFRITRGSSVQTLDVQTNSFKLTQLASYTHNTTYSLDVAVQTGGTWSPYGTAYNVTTPVPVTQVSTAFRGNTLANIDAVISADPILLATGYRFRVTRGSNVQTIDTQTNSFKLTQLASYAHNATYSLDVAVQTGGTWSPYGTAYNLTTPVPVTQVSESYRGNTLAGIDAAILADPVLLAAVYRFRVTQGANIQTLDVQTNSFKLTQLASYAYDTTYSLDVAVQTEGTWSAYGAPYEVITPNPALTQIKESFRGKTIAHIDSTVLAESVLLASGYRFRVTREGNAQIIDAQTNSFKFTQLTGYLYNTTYSVDVAIQIGNTWNAYGATYEVSTPLPSTQLSELFRGNTLTKIDSTIYADEIPEATGYRFRVTKGADEQILETETNSFKLTDLSSYAYSTTYNVDVQVELGGDMGAFGAPSLLSTPAPVTQIRASQCGSVLDIEAAIYADGLPLATAYRFKVTQGENTYVLEEALRYTLLYKVPFYFYNTTYSVQVAAKIGEEWTEYGAACNVTTIANPVTQLGLAICGQTLANPNGEIHANSIYTATAYRFKITRGGVTDILEEQFRQTLLAKSSLYAYNATFTIQVAAKVGENWTEYGTACTVTTMPTPIPKMHYAICGTELTVEGIVRGDAYPLTTAYRFKVIQGANEQILEETVPYTLLYKIGFYTYNTTYSISMSANIAGTWTDYGPACDIRTIALPLTQLASTVCGSVLTSMNGQITSGIIPTATAYRFKITNGSNEEVMESGTTQIFLSSVSFYTYNTTYNIQVAAKIAGDWTGYGPACNVTTPVAVTQLGATFCGQVMTDVSGQISADLIPTASAYKFKITQGSNEQVVESGTRQIFLSSISFYAYNTTYSVKVSAKIAGVWINYGSACNVTTPIAVAQLGAAFCGKVLAGMDGQITSTILPKATAYKFKITQGGKEEVIESGTTQIFLSSVSFYTYNTTYSIQVSAKIAGNWTDYGPACNVTTAVAVTQVGASLCGQTLVSLNGQITADLIPTATAYKFKVTQGGNEEVIESGTRQFYLSSVSFYTYNTTFSIQVSAKIAGVWINYGSACNVTTPVAVTRLAALFCGQVMANMNGQIYSDLIPTATAYRFKISQGGNEQVIESGTTLISLSALNFYAYNTVLSIQVAAKVGGNWIAYGSACNVTTPSPSTSVALSYWGKPLPTWNGTIHADNYALLAAFRFRIREGGHEQIVESATNTMRLSDVSFYAFNTTYNIDVSARVGDTWTPYGAVSTVMSPAPFTNANLSAITLSGGTLTPVFAAGTASYTASVSNSTTSITLSPTVADTTANIKVNGIVVTNRSASGSIDLNVGANTITTVVTAQDGTTSKTYTVIVSRAPSANAELSALAISSGTLTPEFVAGTLSYRASVNHTTTSITLSPTLADVTATVKVNGTTVTSGSASGAIALNVGANTINAIVTAQNGTTIKTYTLKVSRDSSANANLSGIALSNGTLAPVFSVETLSYTASVTHATTSITLSPTLADATATVKVNGTAVASGSASESINLSVGANTITTEVTAQDRRTVKTYTLTVSRDSSTNANLSAIALNNGTLAPVFSVETLSYTASVTHATTSITLSPTLADATATVKVNGTAVASGSASGSINLNVGANTITTEVTAQDRRTVKTYTLTVSRDSSANANLSAIALSAGTLAPVFSAETLSYTASVTHATTSITLSPTLAATATVKVNGTAVASGSASGSINLNVGANIITTAVTAQDGTTVKTYSVVVSRAPSANADLSAMTLSSGTLDPVFDAGTLAYAASVSHATTSMSITPAVSDDTATLTVNGRAVTSGSASESIALTVGANTITTVVTAQDGTTIKSYTVTITRAPSANASLSAVALSNGTLTPAFNADTLAYAVSVSNATTYITLSPAVADATATVKVNGITATSGSASGSIALNVGANTIITVVTAQDETTTKSYTVNVTRAPSANAGLSALTLSKGTLNPTFAAGTQAYTSAVSNTTTSITLTPTVSDVDATVKVNGKPVNSGSASESISLQVGANTITTEVAAQDGTTIKTYTLTVSRDSSSNADLSALALSAGTLDPVFDSGTRDYTALVGNAITAINVTPAISNTTATITVNGTAVVSGSASGSIALNIGVNTITTMVTAQNGTTKSYTVTVTRASSANTDLLALTLNTGTLDPVFTAGTRAYTASVNNATTAITVSPTVSDATATVKVNGTLVTSGSPSGNIALNVGVNTITIVVTAQDGTTKSYTVSVTRAPSANVDLLALTLSNGTLSPTFAAGTLVYTASVASATTSITLSPTVSDTTATLTVNGTTVTSGSASGNIALNVGANIITTVVTAPDGTTTKSYTVTVTRGPSANADLATLTLSNGTLSPTFAAGTLAYTASVANAVTSITLSPTVSDATATLTLNGTAVTSGAASGTIVLNVGVNTVTTVVKAQDGATTKSYIVTITRAPSANADLSAIALSSGTLDPGFDSATLTYTASVSNATTSVTLSPTVSDGTATVKVNGTAVNSGSSSASISLSIGINTITIQVAAQDGITTKTYTLTLNRAPSSDATLFALGLSSGTLDPLFASNILNYTTYVSNATSSISFTPTITNSATVKVNGTLVSSGSASGSIALAAGNNIFTIVVVSQDGTVTKTFSVKVIRLDPDQVLTDQTGDATVNNTVTQVVVISETKPVIITVSAGTTTSPSVDYGDLIEQGTGTVPQTSVTSSFAQMEIPPATTVTASSSGWDGVLSTPTITTYTLPAIPGQIITTGLIIEVGSPDISLSFDKAVRLQLTGQAGMRIARVHNNIYTEILTTGPEDSQAAGDALPADGSFKINAGNDAVIWTKVFSKFISFSQKTDLNVALVEADKTELTADLIRGSNTDPSNIVSPLQLPQTGSFGSAITWVSSDPSVISGDGQSIFRDVFGSGNKTVTLTATIIKGLITETRSFTLTVPELPNQAPTVAPVTNQVICSNTAVQVIALSGITGGPESAQTTSLSIISDNAAMFSELSVIDNKINYKLNPGASGIATITLTVKDTGGTENGGTDSFSRTFTLTVNPLPRSVISSDLGAEISKGLTALLTVPLTGSGTNYSWANAAGIINGQNTSALSVRPDVSTTYTLTITNSNGCVAVQSFTINVLEDFKTLDVNNILTPNGDGSNDFLVIKNLDMYPDNTLKIFDRVGREIFMKVNYQNDWDGNFKGSPLAAETYYYIIDFGTTHRARLKGYVSIVR